MKWAGKIYLRHALILLYVSSHYYKCVLILLLQYVCPHTAICVSSYYHENKKAGIEPSEVTYQKLYKIYLRDARMEEANEVLMRMRQLMQADGAAGEVSVFVLLYLLYYFTSTSTKVRCPRGGGE